MYIAKVNLNLKRAPSKRCDVLIIDKSGSEYISKCIPSNLSINILNVREGIPYIPKLSFLVFLLRRIFKFKLTYRALITAIVDVVDPTVIISFIDTDIVMGQLDLTFPCSTLIDLILIFLLLFFIKKFFCNLFNIKVAGYSLEKILKI